MARLFSKTVSINGALVGYGQRPYVVAELSANHNGLIENALNTISMAKRCGADAIKLQTYTADTMTIDSKSEDFLIQSGLWQGQTLYDLYEKAHTPFQWHKPLFEHATKEGITCFSTPFDESAVNLLEDLNAPAYKIASFEITDLPLVKYVAATKKPLIVSTGMANKDEIEQLVNTVKESGNQDFILLHCISSYPASFEDMNLLTLQKIAKDFDCLVGLSDHSLGTIASTTAIALGACFIEKHFILDRNIGGPDSSFSLEPNELTQLCNHAFQAWQCLGQANYRIKKAEKENLKYRRSIYAVNDIRKGAEFDQQNIRRIRPGFGLSCIHYNGIIKKQATRDIKRGEPIHWSDVD